ncbi:hypothetical protein [Saccharopolyspora flava]|uniref:Uncharacterized protein n=1 Tax=Saccharopolyspora flava TaxID=95161 RepID=A0A1I6TNX7_9PSEU|nr:hypothetical protein [Saccharopolyspora flava]SFS90880.1 hypothetical protein SAMN05660874_04148 [Saccharopolyspora flava]
MNLPRRVTAELRRVGSMVRGVIISFELAVDDLEAGHYDAEDRERLASYLDNVAAALRERAEVVDGEVVVS